MEDIGELSDEVLAHKRIQVLHSGIRILADQFETEPDESPWPNYDQLNHFLGIPVEPSPASQFGKSAHMLAEAMNNLSNKFKIEVENTPVVLPPPNRTDKNNTGRLKLERQAEPDYVRLTKPRHR